MPTFCETGPEIAAGTPQWIAYHGDCIEVLSDLANESIDFTIYSPPFGDLFVYSDDVADIGNCASDEEFFEHYGYVARELFRVTKPGRIVAVHCSDLPQRKWIEGAIGLKPFSDQLSACHRDVGWILHCRVTVWRDPVVEMQRTKALGLLYKQLRKDSVMSRVGMADYVLVFRKPGENTAPIEHRPETFPLEQWQQWASPIWTEIDQTNVLSGRQAREQRDERHVCPLQLDIIERAVTLWSNPGELVLSPFMGIGSEGYVALRSGRRFVGIELKKSYWQQAVAELQAISAQDQLFAGAEVG